MKMSRGTSIRLRLWVRDLSAEGSTIEPSADEMK